MPERASCPTCDREGELARCGRCGAFACTACVRATHCPRCAFEVVQEVVAGRRISADPGDAKVTYLLLSSSDAAIRIGADGIALRGRTSNYVGRFHGSSAPAVMGHLMDRAGLARITEPVVAAMRSAPIWIIERKTSLGQMESGWATEPPPAGWSANSTMVPPDCCAWFLPGPDEIQILLRQQPELPPSPQAIPREGPFAAVPIPTWSSAQWQFRDEEPPRRCPHCQRVAARYRVIANGFLVCLGCGRSFEMESVRPAARPRDADLRTIYALRDRRDEAATRALVDFFDGGDELVRFTAAQALAGREVPPDLRARVAAVIFGEELDREPMRAHWPLRCAARALLDQPAARAFSEAAPLLQITSSSSRYARVRAEVLLGAVEDRLVRCASLAATGSAELGRCLPDARFRAIAADVARADPSLSPVATMVIDGFRHFAGEDVSPIARHVGLGEGDDKPFPFLVAGFVVATRAQQEAITVALEPLARGAPEGLCWFEHQYGGYSCLQATLVGYGVVLPDDPSTSAAIAAVAETWNFTHGEPMTPPDLVEWSNRLGAVLQPEGVMTGAEALLVSHPCAPLGVLAGLEVLCFGKALAPWHSYVDLGVRQEVGRCGVYTEAHEGVLLRLGAALGLGRPSVALLWGNSD